MSFTEVVFKKYTLILTLPSNVAVSHHTCRPGTQAYEGLRNGLRIDLPVTFDASPPDCAAGGVSGHLSFWRESKPIPRRRLRDLAVEVRLLDRSVDTLCSVGTDFKLLTNNLCIYFFEYNNVTTIFVCDAKRGLYTVRT